MRDFVTQWVQYISWIFWGFMYLKSAVRKARNLEMITCTVIKPQQSTPFQ